MGTEEAAARRRFITMHKHTCLRSCVWYHLLKQAPPPSPPASFLFSSASSCPSPSQRARVTEFDDVDWTTRIERRMVSLSFHCWTQFFSFSSHILHSQKLVCYCFVNCYRLEKRTITTAPITSPWLSIASHQSLVFPDVSMTIGFSQNYSVY